MDASNGAEQSPLGTDLGPLPETARREAEMRVSILRIQKEIALADALDLPAMMHLMAERARDMMGADGGGVELLEDGGIVCRATAGATVLALGARTELQASLAGQAVREQSALYCEDAETDARVNRAIARGTGARSIVVTPLRAGTQTVGLVRVTAARPHAFTQRDVDRLQILVESFGAVIERRRFAERLQASEAQYRLLFEHNPHPMWVLRPADQRFLAINLAALAHYGYTQQEFLALDVDDLWVHEDPAGAQEGRRNIARNQKTFSALQRHRRRDGSLIDVELSADAIRFDGEPARLVLAYDVTDRLRAEREVVRLNRASACSAPATRR